MEVNETTRPLPETPATDVAETTEAVVDEAAMVKHVPVKTREEVIRRLREINENVSETERSEIDSLKQIFYRQHDAGIEAAKKSFVDGGGKEEDFIPPADPYEEEFKELTGSIRKKRADLLAAQEKEKEENLQKKLDILEQMKAITESPEDVNKRYNEFKQLQQEWNEIKSVPATKVNELWKNYQLYTEKFYDMRKLNNEFREYDFKKNLEQKLHLCEAAEKLAEMADPVAASRMLQNLHQEYRKIGPVAKEMREAVWERFKAASSIVNKRHQKYFEEMREKEQLNLDQKTVICEIAESVEYDQLKTPADWENKSKEMQALQAKWKTIGYTSHKTNSKIFERFKKACDEFFTRKADYFKGQKERMAQNYEKKLALCERAEALKDSTDWRKTAEEIVRLQQEWKATGPVIKKYANSLWERFISACDYFFKQKNKANSSKRTEERANLAQKRNILQELKALEEKGDTDAETAQRIRELVKEWNNTGFVPYKDKDKLNEEYDEVRDRLLDKIDLSESEKSLGSFKAGLGKEGNLQRDRDRLARSRDALRTEIQTYENNLGFLNSSSKKGDSLVSEVSRKVERLRKDLELVEKKIQAINDVLKA